MGIKSPETYGEWYWAHSVEAARYKAELAEKTLAPLVEQAVNALHLREILPEEFGFYFDILSNPSDPDLEVLQNAFMGIFNRVAELVSGGQVAKGIEYKDNEHFHRTLIDAAAASLLYQRKHITEDMFKNRLLSQGLAPEEQLHFYKAQMPYPAIPEIMIWGRYHGDPDEIRATVWEKFDVSPDDFDLWNWLSLQRLTTLQVQALFKRGTWDETQAGEEFARLGWSKTDRELVSDLGYVLPNAMLLVQGNLQAEASDDTIISDISKGDIHPDYAEKYLDAVLTKPASLDIVTYELRQDASLSNLDQRLKKLGIHPDYFDVYKTLAYQIPPVADIITMAVREAFTPAIAAQFGQYEDFPADFAKYAAMKGLDEDWAKRYWAAHWSLPSSQQGFQMLHRGVINRGELDMLLRAQDVMPFWRDKLTQIAYRPLTRVDVRRMYKQGVLTEREVFESYLDQGYDQTNSERMAEFTVKQTLASLSKFTSSDIVKAFAGRMISSGDALSLLRSIDIRDEDARYIVSTAEYKRQWAFTEQQIAGIRNLYKRRVYTPDQTRDKLGRLNLPSDQINVLMEQWHFEKVEELDATWTKAEVLKFLSEGLISADRARKELYLNGYDAEHINVYLRSIK